MPGFISAKSEEAPNERLASVRRSSATLGERQLAELIQIPLRL
jgi:hypothetical protein